MPGKIDPFLDDSEYANAMGRVRSLEARLLDAVKLSHMVDAPSAEEAARYLAETEYGGAWEPGADFKDIILSLHKEVARTYREAFEYSPEPGIVDMFALRHLFEGFKTAMKAAKVAQSVGGVAGQGVNPPASALEEARKSLKPQRAVTESVGFGGARADAASRADAAFMIVTSDFLGEDPAVLKEWFMQAATYGEFDDFPSEFRDALNEAFEARSKGAMGSTIDSILDRHSSNLCLSMARKKRNDLLVDLWSSRIDMINLAATLRMKARVERRSRLQSLRGTGAEETEVALPESGGEVAVEVGAGRATGRDLPSAGEGALLTSLARSLIPGGKVPEDRFLAAYGEPWREMPAVFGGDPIAAVCKEGVEGYLAEGSFARLEKEMDRRILGFVKRFRHVSMGPEVIAGYLLAKEYEAKNLRFIMFGKMYGSSPDAIKERLRDVNG
ncbi:MAG TPA: hypothetical protein GX507_05350 [Clostridia bacterium]|nr:hypothetical protein [Clostridia bacterium]